MKWYFLLLGLVFLTVIVSYETSSYTTNNNTVVTSFELNSSVVYTIVNNTFTLTFELNESGSTPSTDTCSGTINCVVVCGANFTIATGSVNMNDYNITFSGTSGTTYLLANISNYTRITVGNCSVKLNGQRIS